MSHQTTFTDPAAVEAWDARFRWREGSVLHDRTIDGTWARVVNSVASVEGEHREAWTQRWLAGLSRWQWLPDERLLREAGTGVSPTYSTPVTATLNLNAFVMPRPFGAVHRGLDSQAIAETARLALRFLDDALLAVPTSGEPGLRIGMLGMAGALDALGIEYDSPGALQVANDAGAALASGALRAAIELARERGGLPPVRGRLESFRDRGMPRLLVQDALRWGVRHECRTAIAPAPALAMLANNASDALDPRECRNASIDGVHGTLPSPAAQLALRSSIQPWIDEPITYPLATDGRQRDTAVPTGPTPGGPSRTLAALQEETVLSEVVPTPVAAAGTCAGRISSRRKTP